MTMDRTNPLISLGKCIDKLEQGWSPSPSEKLSQSAVSHMPIENNIEQTKAIKSEY